MVKDCFEFGEDGVDIKVPQMGAPVHVVWGGVVQFVNVNKQLSQGKTTMPLITDINPEKLNNFMISCIGMGKGMR